MYLAKNHACDRLSVHIFLQKGGDDMNKLTRLLASFGFTAVGLLAANPVSAQLRTNFTGSEKPLLGSRTPQANIGQVINVALGFLAFVAVILILYGGFLWMTAAGNEDRVDQAKKLLAAAVIGLIIILAAWGISVYAIGTLGSATGTTVQ